MARTQQDWEELAERQLLKLVTRERAVHWLEAEALLAETRYDGESYVNPHHLSTARASLLKQGKIQVQSAPTRGGRTVGLLIPGDTRGIKTDVARVAQHKRLLAARYLGWASGGAEFRHGIIGPTGERVVRRTILAASVLRPAMTGAEEVGSLLGVELDGPLDSGGLLPSGDMETPGPVVAVAVEVKSVRDWIYPSSKELFQLLDKASQVERDKQSPTPVLPLLVCRRAHYTTFKMAKAMGFFVAPLNVQYVSSGAVGEKSLNEVRNGLHLEDLRPYGEDDGADQVLFRRIKNTLPMEASELAEQWSFTCRNQNLRDLFKMLRNQHQPPDRERYVTRLRSEAEKHGLNGGW